MGIAKFTPDKIYVRPNKSKRDKIGHILMIGGNSSRRLHNYYYIAHMIAESKCGKKIVIDSDGESDTTQ